MTNFTINLPVGISKLIDKLQDKGIIKDRSDIVNIAINDLIGDFGAVLELQKNI